MDATLMKHHLVLPEGWELFIYDRDALDEQRQDSVWYATGYGDYRVLHLSNGTDTYYVYAVGEVRITHRDHDGVARDYHKLQKWGITNDTQLKEALDNEVIEFDNNNWYEVVDYLAQGGEGEWSEYAGGDLQEMIDYTINEFHPWIKENN